MAKTELTREILEAMILGGSLLGGGGRGTTDEALEVAEMALKFGPLYMTDPEDMDPGGIAVTCSAVTCPHRKDFFIPPKARIRSLELLLESGIARPAGLIPSECSSMGVVNGLLESAVLGIPLVDVACNGRGHPTPEMGSMGLHLDPGYVSSQAFAGGNEFKKTYIEGVLRGDVGTVSNLIRHNACEVRGVLAAARNPVNFSFVMENGAPGALKQAIRIGKAMREAGDKGPEALIEAAAELLSAEVVYCGEAETVDRFTAGGFDSGTAVFGDLELSFWNEYMVLERGEERLATFPDLITVLDCDTGAIIPSDALKPGMRAALFTASRRELKLGGGMRSPELYEHAEKIIGKPILPFLYD
ncbi:MAG: DUF917 family protein [Aminivibrio sp.]|jgi:DUF917 family protein